MPAAGTTPGILHNKPRVDLNPKHWRHNRPRAESYLSGQLRRTTDRRSEMVRIKSLLAGASLTLRGAAYSRRRVHIMAMPGTSGTDTRRSRAGGAEIVYRSDNGGAGERAPLRGS